MLNRVQIRWLTWPLQNIPLLFLSISWVAFAVCHFPSVLWRAVQSTLLHLAESGQTYIPIPFRIHLAASVFCHIINKHQWPRATWGYACLCHHTASSVFYRRCCMLWIMSCFKLFFFPSFWYRLILVSLVQRMLFQNWSGEWRLGWMLWRGFSSSTVVFLWRPGLFMLLSSPVHSFFSLRM